MGIKIPTINDGTSVHSSGETFPQSSSVLEWWGPKKSLFFYSKAAGEDLKEDVLHQRFGLAEQRLCRTRRRKTFPWETVPGTQQNEQLLQVPPFTGVPKFQEITFVLFVRDWGNELYQPKHSEVNKILWSVWACSDSSKKWKWCFEQGVVWFPDSWFPELPV